MEVNAGPGRHHRTAKSIALSAGGKLEEDLWPES
jgi:hypothetical protein